MFLHSLGGKLTMAAAATLLEHQEKQTIMGAAAQITPKYCGRPWPLLHPIADKLLLNPVGEAC
jgi:hypothetical protein